MDITFPSGKEQNGGILIRGIKNDEGEVIGPRRVLSKIFESLGSVTQQSTIYIKNEASSVRNIMKTTRHLPNKTTYQDFHDKQYRYLRDWDVSKKISGIKDIDQMVVLKDNSSNG